MSKAVMIAIQPKWCEKIASLRKTVEVRKTQPKLKTPFKCYIYCTRSKKYRNLREMDEAFGGGMVIGEFVCDSILDTQLVHMSNTCLSVDEWLKYTDGHKGRLYGWHISDVMIYDRPKELSEFIKPCENDLYCEICAMYSEFSERCYNAALRITRPPQSWCYVEDFVGGVGN